MRLKTVWFKRGENIFGRDKKSFAWGKFKDCSATVFEQQAAELFFVKCADRRDGEVDFQVAALNRSVKIKAWVNHPLLNQVQMISMHLQEDVCAMH